MNDFFEVELFVEPDLEFFQQFVFLWSFKLIDHAMEKARDFHSLCSLYVSCNFRHQLLLIEMIVILAWRSGIKFLLALL